MQSLTELLELNADIPNDPFEALLQTRARMQRLNGRICAIMTACYPDFETVIQTLGRREEVLLSAVGSFSVTLGDS